MTSEVDTRRIPPTGLNHSGSHALVVKMTTDNGLTATSPTVTVTVSTPAPTVAIMGPSNGATVSGTVSVTFTGSVDSSQSDTPESATLYVDGTQSGYASYCGISKTCSGSLSWNATGLSGSHALVVKMTTDNGLAATSPAVTVTVS